MTETISSATEMVYPEYFKPYINLVKEKDLTEAFANQQTLVDNYFDTIDEEKSCFAYAPGKWTLKELLQHMIDAERIFCYRALAFARKETVSLPGFDEDTYAANSAANNRSWKSLCEEYKAVRKAMVLLFDNLSNDMLYSTGVASNKPVSVIAIGFITIGHLYHHKNIIEERYL